MSTAGSVLSVVQAMSQTTNTVRSADQTGMEINPNRGLHHVHHNFLQRIANHSSNSVCSVTVCCGGEYRRWCLCDLRRDGVAMTWNPDAAELQRVKYDLVCEGYRRGKITEAVFMASLYALGYSGARLMDEKRYQDGLKEMQPIGKAANRVVNKLSGVFYEFP